MIRQTVYCDRCKAVIPPGSDRTELAVEAGPLSARHDGIDLCGGCGRELEKWLSASALTAPPLAGRCAS